MATLRLARAGMPAPAVEAMVAVALAAALALPASLAALWGPPEAAWTVVGAGALSFGLAALWAWRRPLPAVGAFFLWTAMQRVTAALVAPHAEAESVQALLAYKDAMYLALLAAGVAAVVPRLVAGERQPVLWTDGLALAFMALVGAHFLLSDASLDDRLTYLRRWWAPCLLYLAGRLLWASRPSWRQGVMAFVAVMAAVAAFGLVERFLLPPSFWTGAVNAVALYERLVEAGAIPRSWLFVYRGMPDGVLVSLPQEVPVRRLVSTFVEPTTLAFSLALASLLAAAATLTARNGARWAWGTVAGVCVAALAFTFGRGGMLAALVGLAALGLASAGLAWRGGPGGLRPLSLGRPAAVLGPLALVLAAGIVVSTRATVPARGDVQDFLLWSSNMPPPQVAAAPLPAPEVGPPPPAFDHPPGSAAEGAERHLGGLREGLESAFRHPLGLGLGQAGVLTEAPEVGGESTIGALAAQLGLPGLILWPLFSLAVSAGLGLAAAREAEGLGRAWLLALATAHLGLLVAAWFTESASGVTGVAPYYLLAGWGLGTLGAGAGLALGQRRTA